MWTLAALSDDGADSSQVPPWIFTKSFRPSGIPMLNITFLSALIGRRGSGHFACLVPQRATNALILYHSRLSIRNESDDNSPFPGPGDFDPPHANSVCMLQSRGGSSRILAVSGSLLRLPLTYQARNFRTKLTRSSSFPLPEVSDHH